MGFWVELCLKIKFQMLPNNKRLHILGERPGRNAPHSTKHKKHMFFQDLGAYTRGRSRYHKTYENWERLGECDSDFAKHVDNKCFGLDGHSPDIAKHVRSALVIPPTICPQPPSFSGYRSIANVRALLAAFRSAWEGLVTFISGWKRLGAFGGLWNVWQRLGCLGAFRSVWESWDAAWERMGAFRSVREGLKTFGKFLTRVGTFGSAGGG